MEEGFQTVNLHGCASGVIATPVIGQNGNWFIGNKDTGVCAKGVEGDKGENGQQGSKGDQGDVGPAGAQGIQGIQGIQGEQGIKGDRGDIGEQGVQGLQGTQGKQGPKGDKGDTGPVGPQGEQGPKGTDADNAELERLSDEVVKVNQSLDDCDLITEGSGADTKYYIQKGADTASKKLLGRTPIEYRLTCTSGSSAFDGVAEITIPCEGYNKLTLRYKIDTINGTNGIAVKIDNATVLNIVLPNQEQTSTFSLIKSKNVFVKLIANYNAYCDISLS